MSGQHQASSKISDVSRVLREQFSLYCYQLGRYTTTITKNNLVMCNKLFNMKTIIISANTKLKFDSVDISSKATENTPWMQDVNRSYIKRSEDVRGFLNVFTFNLCPVSRGDAIFGFQMVPCYPWKTFFLLTLYAPTLQNGQTHSNNSSATADELFKCVWLFCEVGT